MNRFKCEYTGQSPCDEGRLVLFKVDTDDAKALEQLKGKLLIAEVNLYRSGRSLNANAYFWKLCSMLAEVLGSTKDDIYIIQLQKYGQFHDVELYAEAVPAFSKIFKYSEEMYRNVNTYIDEYGDMVEREIVGLRCYEGSHSYDSKQMSVLINGTVSDCHDAGIQTWEPEEVERLLRNWKGEK